jgi:hypothetical protein
LKKLENPQAFSFQKMAAGTGLPPAIPYTVGVKDSAGENYGNGIFGVSVSAVVASNVR